MISKTAVLFFFTLLLIATEGFSQKPDTVLYRYAGGKDSVREVNRDSRKEKRVYVYESGNPSFISYYNMLGRYRSRGYFEDGKRQSRSNLGIFRRVLRSKAWDEDGRVLRRSRQYPFGSTSYTVVRREKPIMQKAGS